MANEINLNGMEELITRLQTVNGKVANETTKAALNAGAQIIQKGVSEKIPRSNAEKEHAADHIIISKLKKKDGISYVQVGPDKGDNSKFFYLKFIEWGTVKMAAQAPFGRTLAEEKNNVKSIMVKTLKEGLKL
jgi:HK97 gp10 family phage protein